MRKINTISFLKIRLDDRLTSLIVDNISLFKYVHPNIITLIGLILNFAILYVVLKGHFISSVVLLAVRYLADCLDGGVARKYNKKSKIGGALDTWSDTILIYVSIVGLFIINDLSFGSEIAAFVACANLYVMSLTESLFDHAGMKTGSSLLSNIYAFLVNNSFILFLLHIIILYLSVIR